MSKRGVEEDPGIGDGRARVVIERVRPAVDCGRFPVKRTVGQQVAVSALVFADGHDLVGAALEHRPIGETRWRERPLEPQGEDRWRGTFPVERLGGHEYRVIGWIDRFATWRRDLQKRVLAGQRVHVELVDGAALVRAAAARAEGAARVRLLRQADAFEDDARPEEERAALAAGDDLADAVRASAPRDHATASPPVPVTADSRLARFAAWYELFPRSASPEPDRHGTFGDVEARLPYVAEMGFDVLYLPPIHPIGRANRKGRNNAVTSGPDDVGSPWAIGAEEGGHLAVHPALGTLDDFRRLVKRADEHGLRVAMDVAFQCAPDHPWVAEHPTWFRRRSDGSIRHAENPPKRYEDIVPFDFECEEWEELWAALRDVFLFWIEQGVNVFRVDNPHTKPLPFWEWCIAEVRARHPETVFLSEAFTRPNVMYRLAKAGFDVSYTYFAWKNTAHELREYLEELTTTDAREFFRPSFWPNTPDILNEYLQIGGRPAFQARLVLAGTLSASYGIYGPAFELCEARPREPGSEEYLDSEKYQLRTWDLDRPDSLRGLITRLNRIRRENAALQRNEGLVFHETDNEFLLCYGKATPDLSNVVLCVVNLDPAHAHSGFVELDLDALGLDPETPFQVHDLVGGARFLWTGSRNYVSLDPEALPAHVFRVRRRVRTERDFEYFA